MFNLRKYLVGKEVIQRENCLFYHFFKTTKSCSVSCKKHFNSFIKIKLQYVSVLLTTDTVLHVTGKEMCQFQSSIGRTHKYRNTVAIFYSALQEKQGEGGNLFYWTNFCWSETQAFELHRALFQSGKCTQCHS